jgi:hypothetical protein
VFCVLLKLLMEDGSLAFMLFALGVQFGLVVALLLAQYLACGEPKVDEVD